jgi:hypothetical protein
MSGRKRQSRVKYVFTRKARKSAKNTYKVINHFISKARLEVTRVICGSLREKVKGLHIGCPSFQAALPWELSPGPPKTEPGTCPQRFHIICVYLAW